MRRFYALSTQPTLFGEMSLIRSWGRIGTNGQTMVLAAQRQSKRSDGWNALSGGAVTLHSTESCHSQAIFRGLRLRL